MTIDTLQINCRKISSEMGKPKQPKVISSKRFGGTDPLSANDLKRLTIDSFAQAGSLVEDWHGEPMLIPGLTLSQDNTKVESATPVLIGTVFNKKPLVIDCEKIWSFKRKVLLHIKATDLNTIPFKASLVSELVDGLDLNYVFVDADTQETVEDSELAEDGFEGFTTRFHLHPCSSRSAKVELMFYPLDKAKLTSTYKEAEVFVFPGLELLKLEIELGIQRDELLDNNYGLPILPVIRTREALKSTSKVPSRSEIV